MKRAKVVSLLLAFALGVAASADGFARGGKHGGHFRHVAHRHGHIGVFIGPAWYPPHYYYPPPYYYPYYPPVVSAPPTYIEQAVPQASAPLSSGYWYYCSASGAYYPYVKECAGGWQPVAPQPAQ